MDKNKKLDDKDAEKQRSDENNAKNIKNAADVAIASKNPYAMAAGKAVKLGDKLTGGKVSKTAGKAMTQINKHAPMGKTLQNTSNKLAESGTSDTIGKAASLKNKQDGNSEKKAENKKNQEKENLQVENNTSRKTSSQEETKNEAKAEVTKSEKKPKVLLILIVIVLIIFSAPIALLIVIISLISGSGMSATAGYYPIDCQDVTVIFVDKSAGYAVTGSGTYPIDEYVAGVLQGEVGEFQNLEIYKQFAIAARSYFLRNQSNCTIEASDRKQVFREITSSNTNTDLMRQAAQETSGIVLLDGNGQLVNSEYDAFCSIAVDANYYTIKQQNQKIPRNWVDSQGGIAASWKRGDCSGNHGRGMSQWGSYYLATEENYTYDNLISYYLGNDNVSISSKGILATIVDLAIKSTTDAVYQLDQSLPGFLASKGSSLEEYNNYIRASVEKAGVGTREGVVAAAVSSITFLYDNFNTKLPYYWGGHYTGTIGIPSSFGNSVPSIPSPSGKRYPYISFDCSGFVNWAIVNGGYKFSDTNNYASKFSGCNITNSSCTGQPGDIIDSPSHVVMIVSVDETNNKYYVAESTVSGVIIQTRGMHDRMSGENTQVLHLDSLYNNKANVNSNY